MFPKSFLSGVFSTLGIFLLLIIAIRFAGYTLERPLKLSDLSTSLIQSGSTEKTVDCSSFGEGSAEKQNCQDAQVNNIFTQYMNLSENDRLAFNCRELLTIEQQKFCVQQKSDIPKQQKQTKIMNQLALGGDITLCNSFSSEKIEQDRCRLDFVLDRLPHDSLVPKGEVTSSGLKLQRTSKPKDCTIVASYGLTKQCEQEKEMMKKFDNGPIKNNIQ